MIERTFVTWFIAIFGVVTFLPLFVVQFLMLLRPDSQQTKDIIIGKGEDWRDKTHFKSAYAFAWADLLIIMPLLVSGNIGVILGYQWGYVIWVVLGFISVYFSIVFWVMEKEYAYPSCGLFAYYTFFWGFYLYWGIVAIIYSILQLK